MFFHPVPSIRRCKDALYLLDGGPPKVIEKDVLERNVWSQVPIVFDGADVVEDEAAVKAVVITDDTCHHQDET